MVPLPKPPMRRSDLKQGECLCDYCIAKCCRYFALPIETPTTGEDFDIVRWYLLHDKSALFTEDDVWYLVLFTECRHLQPDNRCGIYETRPAICRDYATDNCEFDNDAVYERYFETPEQVQEYAEALLPRKKKAGIRSNPPPLLPVLG